MTSNINDVVRVNKLISSVIKKSECTAALYGAMFRLNGQDSVRRRD